MDVCFLHILYRTIFIQKKIGTMRKLFTLFASLFMIASQLCADSTSPLNFTAVNGPATVSLSKRGNPDAISLQYSTDNCATWSNYTVGQYIQLASGAKVYFKATSRNANFSKDQNNYYSFWMIGTVSADGNIMSLLDATMQQTSVPDHAFHYLFMDCTSLIQAPALPATTLAEHCYHGMFSGCSLTQAPALPATTLAEHCYYGMFGACRSLTQAPALPATTLALGCYSYMFGNCSSLTQVPASLPATTLADECYSNMFWRCSSLTHAPALPATTLAEGCYSYMFEGCSSLTQAPALPATTLAKECYYAMFQSCSSLTQVPALPATTLAECCYYGMFCDCRSLIVNTEEPGMEWKIPENATPAHSWNKLMFSGTGGNFTGAPEIGVTYYIASATTNVENVNDAEYVVYSNHGRIFVNGAAGAPASVYDVNGRLVATTDDADETHEFDVETAGIYFVRINDRESVKVIVK